MSWTYEPSPIHRGFRIISEDKLIATIHASPEAESLAKMIAQLPDLLEAAEEVIGFGNDLASFNSYARLQLAVKKARE